MEVKIHFKAPSVKVEDIASEEGATLVQKTGIMILRSLPLYAVIFLDGAKIGKADKKISNVPAGKHMVKFVFKGKELDGSFDLKPEETLKLKGHFKKNMIVDVTAVERKREYEERKKIEAERIKRQEEERKKQEEEKRRLEAERVKGEV